MKKETIQTVSYLFASGGLFLLALTIGFCGTDSQCQQSKNIASSTADFILGLPLPLESGNAWMARFKVDLSS